MSVFSTVIRSISSTAQGRILYILIIRDDWPYRAFCLNLSQEVDLISLRRLIELADQPGWAICQFKNKKAYNKGRRMVGQHLKLWSSGQRDGFGRRVGIRSGKFQGLVEPLGYRRLPLSDDAKVAILQDYRSEFSVTKIADDWDVSESYIRGVIKKDKLPVSPLKKTINKGISESKPPSVGRVGRAKGGFR